MAQDSVALIKERLSIQDVVAPYVKLRRAGKSLTGLCPFHKEKTGSFHVSVDRGTYHCFGCGEGGDMFAFIEKVEGVDFKTALRQLAERAGVQLEAYTGARGEDASRKDRLREVMQRAAAWYAAQLTGSEAYTYALSRGLNEATITAWGLGYAPDTWRALLEALTAEGITVAELLAAGLIKEADGKPGTYYDRFRNRLMFPIRDAMGKVVAFTGRALAADDLAKYLNSPETPLYVKSEVLFGMDKAKDAIRVRGFGLLVEGQMDLLHAHQAGFENTIALSGTALTEKHLALIKRYSDNLMLVLDADTAGLSATAKSAQLALTHGIRVKAVRLPMGQDPADLIQSDPQDFAARVKGAQPVVDFFLSVLAERESDPHRLLRVAEMVVLPLIAAVPSPMEREHFITQTARALSLSSEAVRESLRAVLTTKAPEVTARPLRVAPVPSRPAKALREEQLLAARAAYLDTPLARRIETEYARITGVQAPPAETLPESVLFEAERVFGESPLPTAADELLLAFEKAVIREAYQEAIVSLRKAESVQDHTKVSEAQARCAALSQELARLG